LLDLNGRSVGRLRRTVGTVIPIHTVEPFAFGSLDPAFNGRFTNAKLFRNLTQRLSPPYRFNRRPSVLRTRTLRFVSYSNSFKKQTIKIP
jgi:hypothetical protein